MINLRILFGWVPKTADFESGQESLRNEYARLKEFSQSKDLAGYLELEKTVKSSDFERRKKTIARQKFSDTPEYRNEREFLKMKKQNDIINYYRIKESVELKDFIEFENSQDLKHYHTLDKLVSSDEFLRQRKNLGRKKFRKTPEFEKLQEFKALKSSGRLKNFFSFKNSKKYQSFNLLIGSEKITQYEKLGKFVKTDEFKKVKDYMLLPGTRKLEMSEEYRMEQKYRELKKSETFKWYFATRNSKKFDEIKRWDLTFSEEFDGQKLDSKKWLTRYFWGDKILKDSYVNMGEKQFYTGEKNIAVSGSILKVQTRREKAAGKVWNPAIGFFPKDFDYTSAIINTGNSFRQQYGLFEAKIRFNRNFPVNHAFWLVSDLMVPHIDVARASKKISVGTYWGNPNVKKGIDKRSAAMSREKYGFDYFIFSLEWSKNKMIWKVNGIPAYSTTTGIPHIPMYVNVNSAIYQDMNGTVLPAELEVDWVRCYQKVSVQ
jgi:beta-glucanase (GH16 family)